MGHDVNDCATADGATADGATADSATLARQAPAGNALLARAAPTGRAPGPVGNRLLDLLPSADWQRWLAQLESVSLTLGQVLYESGRVQNHVYFPTSSVVSLLYVTENGASAEMAAIGSDGVVGVPLFMGGASTTGRAVVQCAGHAFRLAGHTIQDEFARSGPVMRLLLRYTQALITQMAHLAVCNRHHSVDQQVCRWLLLSVDRLQGTELVITQELIANALGVRRESVTEVALALQRADLIRYARGRISVLDRCGLEARSCECYALVRDEVDRLLPRQAAPPRDEARQPGKLVPAPAHLWARAGFAAERAANPG